MNKNIYEILHILECPDCRGKIDIDSSFLKCLACKRNFVIDDNILDMSPIKKMPIPDVYQDPNYVKVKQHETINYMYGSPILRTVQFSGHKMVERFSEDADFTVEVGCGNGAHYAFVKNKNKMIGLDINRERLLSIAHKEPEAPLILGDNYSLPFKSNSIPQIISIYTLEHMYFLTEALEEKKRVLRNNGRLLVSIPAEGGIFWSLGRRFSTERHFSKKLNVDYKKYIKIEHCNSAKRVLKLLKEYFAIEKIMYWPTLIPSINFNLTITIYASRK